MTDIAYPVNGYWTIADLQRMTDDGLRYELSDGSLIVSPPPATPHLRTTFRLRRLLTGQAPVGMAVLENAGITMADGHTYRIPDLIVLPESALAEDRPAIGPEEILLAVEVLSPDSAGDDLITKRHQYGRAGIPHYWIVDQKQRLLRVLRHDGDVGYTDRATIPAGQEWRSGDPFDLILDPAEFL